MKGISYVFITAALILAVFGCGAEKSGTISENIRPETHVHLTGDLDTTRTVQILHWWGDDIDGEIEGFFYIWGNPEAPIDDWTWTTASKDTFYLGISPGLEAEVKEFYIKAVDNSAVFNSDEVTDETRPVDFTGAIDETPAQLFLPVKNTPPEISFFPVRSNPDFENLGMTVHETYPIRTFFFDADDYDGDVTLKRIEYTLDDPDFNDPVVLEPTAAQVTLTDLTPGEHIFYIRTIDIAEAVSPIIRFPETDEYKWVVKEISGDVLLIDDDALESGDANTNFYNTALTELGITYSTWNLEKYLPYSGSDLTKTLNFFDIVIWYSGNPPTTSTTTNIQTAATSIEDYLYLGKSMLLNSPKICNDDLVPYSFAPIDTVLDYEISRVLPDTDFETLEEGYPDIKTSDFLSKFVGFDTAEQSDSILVYPLYKLPEAPSTSFWDGEPDIGLVKKVENKKGEEGVFVYISFPIYKADGNGNAKDLILHILEQEFGFGGVR